MSVADKASYLSRFTMKFVEIVAAGAATAVSGYLVAHFGAKWSAPTPPATPAIVQAAPSIAQTPTAAFRVPPIPSPSTAAADAPRPAAQQEVTFRRPSRRFGPRRTPRRRRRIASTRPPTRPRPKASRRVKPPRPSITILPRPSRTKRLKPRRTRRPRPSRPIGNRSKPGFAPRWPRPTPTAGLRPSDRCKRPRCSRTGRLVGPRRSRRTFRSVRLRSTRRRPEQSRRQRRCEHATRRHSSGEHRRGRAARSRTAAASCAASAGRVRSANRRRDQIAAHCRHRRVGLA